jgi:hypothetical protein
MPMVPVNPVAVFTMPVTASRATKAGTSRISSPGQGSGAVSPRGDELDINVPAFVPRDIRQRATQRRLSALVIHNNMEVVIVLPVVSQGDPRRNSLPEAGWPRRMSRPFAAKGLGTCSQACSSTPGDQVRSGHGL